MFCQILHRLIVWEKSFTLMNLSKNLRTNHPNNRPTDQPTDWLAMKIHREVAFSIIRNIFKSVEITHSRWRVICTNIHIVVLNYIYLIIPAIHFFHINYFGHQIFLKKDFLSEKAMFGIFHYILEIDFKSSVVGW